MGLKRSGRIKPKRRTSREFVRIYGSRERVRFVSGLPCVVPYCTCPDPRQNAHIVNGGIGRKADADKIVPLCPPHHRELHDRGPSWFASRYDVVPEMLDHAAEATEVAWRAHCGEFDA